jgi:Suppressor of fused protein (SUFU)
MTENGDWFESTWRYRDEVLYPEQFRGSSDGLIRTIPYIAFAQLGAEQVDPRWLHCGVLAFPPTRARDSVIYVTSGLSNAWDDNTPDSESTSGLGLELRIDSPSQEHWAFDILLRLSALQLLIGAGRITGGRLLGHGDRIRVGAGAFGEHSAMTSLIGTKVADLQIQSGMFELIQLFPITDAERELAARQGLEALSLALRQNTTYPVSDCMRCSVV